jgi:hypothetical protein
MQVQLRLKLQGRQAAVKPRDISIPELRIDTQKLKSRNSLKRLDCCRPEAVKSVQSLSQLSFLLRGNGAEVLDAWYLPYRAHCLKRY